MSSFTSHQIPFGAFPEDRFADAARTIRKEVFVEEQGVDPSLEQDDRDAECAHLIGIVNDIPVTTMRIRKTEEGLKFERIAVLKKYRGMGYGSKLITDALHRFKGEAIYLHAQEHAANFYHSLGFFSTGEKTTEAGIPHVTMRYHA